MTTSVTIENFTINGTDWGTCTLLVEGFYGGSGAPDICAFTADGEYLAPVTASVSVGDDSLVLVNHGGSEGMLAALVAAGLVKPTGRVVASGYVEMPEVRPLGGLAAMIERARQPAAAAG